MTNTIAISQEDDMTFIYVTNSNQEWLDVLWSAIQTEDGKASIYVMSDDPSQQYVDVAMSLTYDGDNHIIKRTDEEEYADFTWNDGNLTHMYNIYEGSNSFETTADITYSSIPTPASYPLIWAQLEDLINGTGIMDHYNLLFPSTYLYQSFGQTPAYLPQSWTCEEREERSAGRYDTNSYSGRYEYELDESGNVILMTSYEDDEIDEIIRFSYETTTGIAAPSVSEYNDSEPRYYNLNGIGINQPQRGLSIVRDGNGRTRKLFIR